MSKLFPILADPNAPSSFNGIDLSLAEGQMTALDSSSNSFTMNASTLTANGVSATWADIVDGVVNPPATPALQAVLQAGDTAVGQEIILQDTFPSTMNYAFMTPERFSATSNDGTGFSNLYKNQLYINNSSGVVGELNPDSVSVGYIGEGPSQLFRTTLSMTGSTGVIASSTSITLDSANDVVLSAGADSLTFTKDAMLSASAGGSTDQYLVVNINGTTYRISLLASPAP